MTDRDVPLVSVVTIAWRNAAHAEAFVDSLAEAASRTGGSPELIVVVNGLEGAEAAEAIRAASARAGLGPTMVELATNTGFSGGANAGVERATGQIVVLSNLDVVFDKEFLTGLCQAYALGGWDLLAPRVRQGPNLAEAGVSRRRFSHRLAWVPAPPADAGPVPAGNGSCIVLHRSTLDLRVATAGTLFDPEYHSFNEDIDLFWWAEHDGLTVRYVPQVQIRHALAGSFGGDHRFVARPVEVQRRVLANYRVTVWKNARGVRDWLGWPWGEALYLGQTLASRRVAGLRLYVASWGQAFETVRAIRRRRGRLRVASSKST